MIIGITGFLSNDKKLTALVLGFLITGLILLFITIPINLVMYIPTFKPWRKEVYVLTFELSNKKKKISVLSIIILAHGMLFGFIAILLIAII
ncbi:MAG: hypothetical protein ACTSO7_17545 [Candidatus Heimdallarchaeota archaeon]